MIGKSEARPIAIEAIKDHKAVYLMAVGGAAYLVARPSRAPRSWPSRNWGWKAIYEFEVERTCR